MILFILLILAYLYFRFAPSVVYVRQSNVLVFYFFSRKNIRKRIIFKL